MACQFYLQMLLESFIENVSKAAAPIWVFLMSPLDYFRISSGSLPHLPPHPSSTLMPGWSFKNKSHFMILLKTLTGAGELAWRLRAPPALTGGPWSVSSPTWWLTNIYNSCSRASDTFIWPPWAGTRMVYIYTSGQNTHIKQINL